MAESAPAETLDLLARLSNKPGVRSTLILSRSTGSIVQSTGFSTSTSESNGTSEDQPTSISAQEAPEQSATTVARAVYTFVKAADAMASDISTDDDIRLLRMRLKRTEVVIVPNAKFLLVVMHDTS